MVEEFPLPIPHLLGNLVVSKIIFTTESYSIVFSRPFWPFRPPRRPFHPFDLSWLGVGIGKYEENRLSNEESFNQKT